MPRVSVSWSQVWDRRAVLFHDSLMAFAALDNRMQITPQ
jgi:hypothetical protein